MSKAPLTSPRTFSLSPATASPSLDQLVKEQFEQCRLAGILRNDPLDSDVLRRSLSGRLGLIAEYEPSLFSRKRAAAVDATVVDMDEPFDERRFHFNKVGQEEVLVYIRDTGGHDHPILVNVSPLMCGHGLLVPWGERGLPQRLTSDAVTLVIRLMLAAGECEFCVGFNSLGAFSSVNHLHLHVLYPGELDHQARLGGEAPLLNGRHDFPIARAPIHRNVTQSYGNSEEKDLLCHCRVDLLDWMVPCFSFWISEKENDPEIKDVGAVTLKLQQAVSRFVSYLHGKRIPHNVLFLKDPSCRLRVVIIPRQPQHHFDSNRHGFNAALGEISGMLIAKTREQFEAFEEATIRNVMEQYVACEDHVLADILAELKGVSG